MQLVRSIAIYVVPAALLTFSLPDESPAADWQAGTAVVKVTPTEPMWMAGYANRNKPSEGTALDLYCKAIALEDAAGARLVIVTCDLIGIPRGLREGVAADVKEKFGLPPESLLLNASHTHCGPEFRNTGAATLKMDDERTMQGARYGDELRVKLVALIGEAIGKLSPATLHYSHSRCGFAMNRRTPSDTGYKNNPWSEGPVDQTVPVLKIAGPDGKLRAVLFGYACHNTTLSFYQFCGDYAGYAQQHLEEKFPGVTAHFLMGCGGDQNPYPRGELELCRHHGKTLGIAVEAALQSSPQKEVRGPLKSAIGNATLEFAPPPPKEVLERQTKSPDKYEARHAERLLEELASTGKIAVTYDAPLQAVQFGRDLTLIAFSGETVVDYSLRAKREYDGEAGTVWTAGYSNDVFAYVPSKRVLLEGGYEGGGAMRYGRFPGPFAIDVEDRVMQTIAKLVRDVRATSNAAGK